MIDLTDVMLNKEARYKSKITIKCHFCEVKEQSKLIIKDKYQNSGYL